MQFCTFLVNNGHPKGHQIKFRDTMTMYQPKEKNNYYKVAQLITHQKIAFPTIDPWQEDRQSEVATAMQSDLERASADLTGCSGVYSLGQKLKLFSD